MSKATTAVIPAAGLGLRMLPISGKMPKAMIPVDGKPIISWILNKLIQQGIQEYVIVVGEKKEILIDYINRIYRDRAKITFVTQENLTGPLSAIALAQGDIRTKDQLIILGDTIVFDELTFDKSWVLYHPVNDYWRWCLVETRENQIIRFLDKPDSAVSTDKALVGVYYLESNELWQKSINKVLSSDKRVKNEFQLSSALELYNQEIPITARFCEHWYDCGSIDNYYKTRGELLNVRSFNNVEVDTTVGTLLKKSKRRGKLIDEINWFLELPKECQILTPRILDYSTELNEPYVKFEYYGYQTLSELFLFENVHGKVWQSILARLFSVIHGYWHSKETHHESARENTFSMYWEKTLARISDVNLPDLEEDICINGNHFSGWRTLADRVKKACRAMSENVSWSIVHGDLCFPNILFDVETGLFRFIDPRGKFGNMRGIYGDKRYDISKLYHSVHGKYDFVINDLFDVKQGDAKNHWQLTLFSSAQHDEVETVLRKLILGSGFHLGEILCIEGLLFLSMIPLHNDFPKRQLAFWLIGMQILNEALEEMGQ